RVAGESAEELADFLNHSGLQSESGVPFSCGRVYKIIKNPAYCGTAYSGRHSKPGAHEALAEPADWQRCQFPARGTHRWVEALVAGMIRCASCGAAMTSIRGRSRHGAANYYRCCARPGECESPALARGDEIDPLVE